MKVLGIEFAPIQTPLSRRLQTLAVLYYCTSFLFFGFACIFFCAFLLFYTSYYIFPLLYMAWFVYDHNVCNTGGRSVQWVRRWTVWKWFRDYFPIQVVKTADLSPEKNYIMGYHPHGIICAGAFCNFATEATNFSKLFPGIKPHLLTLEGQFWFPFHREIILSSGTCAATKEGIDWLLSKEGTGHALALVIGGAAEALDAHPGTVTLTLRRRKGFVKLAMKHGASLVPMFSFGENDLYTQMKNPEGSFLRRFQNRLTKIFGFSPPVIYGRGVFQYNMGYLPYRKPVTTVIGKPIDVGRNDTPTAEEIEKVHNEYMESLQKLYEEHKADYGMADVKLDIM